MATVPLTTLPDLPSSSPYFKTPIRGRFLGYYEHRRIDPDNRDRLFRITAQYVHRPDNLAYDIYGDDNYWWIIPVRNGFQDLIFDLELDRIVIVPDPTFIKSNF